MHDDGAEVFFLLLVFVSYFCSLSLPSSLYTKLIIYSVQTIYPLLPYQKASFPSVMILQNVPSLSISPPGQTTFMSIRTRRPNVRCGAASSPTKQAENYKGLRAISRGIEERMGLH